MRKKLYFYIPFCWAGRAVLKSIKRGTFKDWLSYRYNFMCDYTMRSLSAQTVPTEVLIGIDPQFETQVNEVVKKRPLPRFAKIISESWCSYVSKQIHNGLVDADLFYIARIDSDDLYHQDVAQILLSQPEGVRTLQFQTGYLVGFQQKTFSVYHRSSPPFYCDVYSKREVLSQKVLRTKGHNQTIGKSRKMPPWCYCVLCHSSSTQDSSRYAPLLRASNRELLYQSVRIFGSNWKPNLSGFGVTLSGYRFIQPPAMRDSPRISFYITSGNRLRIAGLGFTRRNSANGYRKPGVGTRSKEAGAISKTGVVLKPKPIQTKSTAKKASIRYRTTSAHSKKRIVPVQKYKPVVSKSVNRLDRSRKNKPTPKYSKNSTRTIKGNHRRRPDTSQLVAKYRQENGRKAIRRSVFHP